LVQDKLQKLVMTEIGFKPSLKPKLSANFDFKLQLI